MSGGEIGDIAEDTTAIEVEGRDETEQMVLGWGRLLRDLCREIGFIEDVILSVELQYGHGFEVFENCENIRFGY